MKQYETPSSISSYVYCQRLGGLNKLYPFIGGSKSVATVIGNVEHAAFQEYYNFYRLDCDKHGMKIFKNNEYHKERVNLVSEYIKDSFKILYPSYYQHILDEIPSIRWRLDVHHKQKLQEIELLMRSSKIRLKKAVTIALPFAIETKLNSYNIHGRVDCLYKAADGSILPEDLKSHTNRFDSLIHRDSHKAQLVTYAVLIEAQYKIPVNTARIFYTKDLTYEIFPITNDDKIQILKIKDKLQLILDQGIPPIIDDQLKCSHCYKRRLCEEVAEAGSTESTEFIPLDGDGEQF